MIDAFEAQEAKVVEEQLIPRSHLNTVPVDKSTQCRNASKASTMQKAVQLDERQIKRHQSSKKHDSHEDGSQWEECVRRD